MRSLRLWHLEIIETVWVSWGYGEPESSFEHVSLARSILPTLGPLDFELPTTIPGLPPPREYRRFRSIGWRFNVEDKMAGTNWRVADSSDAALEAARVKAEKSAPAIREHWLLALFDIRYIRDEP